MADQNKDVDSNMHNYIPLTHYLRHVLEESSEKCSISLLMVHIAINNLDGIKQEIAELGTEGKAGPINISTFFSLQFNIGPAMENVYTRSSMDNCANW